MPKINHPNPGWWDWPDAPDTRETQWLVDAGAAVIPKDRHPNPAEATDGYTDKWHDHGGATGESDEEVRAGNWGMLIGGVLGAVLVVVMWLAFRR
jgi:hypothetical protein